MDTKNAFCTSGSSPPDRNTPDFLTVEEAADLLRTDRKTVYMAIRRKQLPGVMRLGRSIRIRRADLLGLPVNLGVQALKGQLP